MRQLDEALRRSDWATSRALLVPMGQIHHETVGLIAFGNIARAMAKRCQALNMTQIASDPFVAGGVAEAGVEAVSLRSWRGARTMSRATCR